MECGNKGICNRKTGECDCFDGYEGAGCKRASCPNECSGHGTCEHIKTLAELDYNNMYDLWDAEMTMGCSCDPGYYGPDCSSRRCKMGIDPLYLDDTTARVQTVDYRLMGYAGGKALNNLEGDSTLPPNAFSFLAGTYAIKFYDVFGEDYETDPIVVDDPLTQKLVNSQIPPQEFSNCDAIVTALETLPNSVIPVGSVLCRDGYDSGMTNSLNELHSERIYNHTRSYSLTFTGNPGGLQQIEIDAFLDGDRPTLYSKVGLNDNSYTLYSGVTADVYNTGVSGEFVDYFSNKCEDVELKFDGEQLDQAYINANYFGVGAGMAQALTELEFTSGYYLSELSDAELKRLKICLGDSDGYSSNNVEVYDWDYGSWLDQSGSADAWRMGAFPHAIKLVNHMPLTDLEGGNFYLTWWNPSEGTENNNDEVANEGRFHIVNPPSTYKTTDKSYHGVNVDVMEVARYHVYTTDGVVERVRHRCGDNAVLCHEKEKYSSENAVNAYVSQYSNVIQTQFDVSCETAPNSVQPCLDKGDLIFVVDTFYVSNRTALSVTIDNFEGTRDAEYAFPTYSTYESGNLYEIKKIYRDDTWNGLNSTGKYHGSVSWNTDYYNAYGEGESFAGAAQGDRANEDPLDPSYTTQYDGSASDNYLVRDYEDRFNIVLDKSVPFAGDELDYGAIDNQYKLSKNNAVNNLGTRAVGMVNIFKFSPATTGTYTYVSECSNRGICDSEAGLCECFKGYTNDDCSVQSSLAV